MKANKILVGVAIVAVVYGVGITYYHMQQRRSWRIFKLQSESDYRYYSENLRKYVYQLDDCRSELYHLKHECKSDRVE